LEVIGLTAVPRPVSITLGWPRSNPQWHKAISK
jgi:hypothetical protein